MTEVKYDLPEGVALRISALSVTPPTAGSRVQCTITAANVTGWVEWRLDFFNYPFAISGCVVDGSGMVRAVLNTYTVMVGPYSPALKRGDVRVIPLVSLTTIPPSLNGQSITVWVGTTGALGEIAVGQPFSGTISALLSARLSVGGGGSGTSTAPPKKQPTPSTGTIEKVVGGAAVAGALLYLLRHELGGR